MALRYVVEIRLLTGYCFIIVGFKEQTLLLKCGIPRLMLILLKNEDDLLRTQLENGQFYSSRIRVSTVND